MKKVVVISGGSDGLGKETARLLASENQVVILSPEEQKLIGVSKEIGCDYEVCDVTDTLQISNAVANILTKYKTIDCLINNAGIWIEGELSDCDTERIRKVIEVNTTGLILLTKAVLPNMKENKKGLIINISSRAGLNALKERSVYTASKWAVTGFTRSLQSELVKYNIKVTGIYPGKMKTKLFEKAGNTKDFSNALNVVEAAKTIKFILSLDEKTTIPDVTIMNIEG